MAAISQRGESRFFYVDPIVGGLFIAYSLRIPYNSLVSHNPLLMLNVGAAIGFSVLTAPMMLSYRFGMFVLILLQASLIAFPFVTGSSLGLPQALAVGVTVYCLLRLILLGPSLKLLRSKR